MTEPIVTAEAVLTDALERALGPTTPRGAHYQIAPQGTLFPYLVYQFQTDINLQGWVGATGATVLVTVKALATNYHTARPLLVPAAAAMRTLTYPGYSITANPVKAPIIPPQDKLVQPALQWRVRLERNH